MKLKLKLNLKPSRELLKYILLFGASFAVINVGMFFVLRMTRPQVGPRAPLIEAPAGRDWAGADSTAVPPADTLQMAEHAPDTVVIVPEAEPVAELAAAEPVAVDTPAVETTPEPEGEPEAVADLKPDDEEELRKLAKALEAMKPADAADIASQLSTDQIVALVMLMKDRTAGRMLAALPVDQAAQVALRMSQTAER